MTALKVLLSLITEDNAYQREQATAAKSVAERLGIELHLIYANNDALGQIQQILSALRTGDGPFSAVVVEPVGTGMPQVAKIATDAGVGWIVLNRNEEYLAPIRQSSSALVGSLDCDNVEVGRIQGRQFGALLPGGGSVLYVEGPSTDASKERRAGMEETLPGNIQIQSMRGKWTEESAFQAFESRLKMPTFSQRNVQVVGCQNDDMAMGARKAVEQLPDAALRASWLKTPFTGCDGVPSTGKAWVQKGLLAATVIIPPLAGLALELLAKARAAGMSLPERTLTKPTSYPEIGALKS